ncbi:class I SAM-dependent methyltransferase [bacterium]|nr:class I SAM-dependent methyltransferase [bacterium]
MKKEDNVIKLLPYLRCVRCNSEKLEIGTAGKEEWSDFYFKTARFLIYCSDCKEKYPVTDDFIPVLWTSALKEIFKSKSKFEKTSQNSILPDKGLLSNIESYEIISDDYRDNWRNDIALCKRMNTAFLKVKNKLHYSDAFCQLDIGCGPGQVLSWLNRHGIKQIGIDVSLKNLRNTRQKTNALVLIGDATVLPIKNDSISLVTSSAVLHHILQWRKVVQESCRVCKSGNGGIIIDSEPTEESLSLSGMACFVFNMRWPVYKILSYFDTKRTHFRDMKFAKNYYRTAEVLNQPGLGIPFEEVENILRSNDFRVDTYLSPDKYLNRKRGRISITESNWKRNLLHLLSGHDPLKAIYGNFTIVASRKAAVCDEHRRVPGVTADAAGL